MITFKAGGRELALAFTLGAMDEIERRTGDKIDLQNVKDTVVESVKDRKKLVTVLAVLAAEGEASEGRLYDGGEAWLNRHMRPGLLPKAQIAVLEAVTEGMSMESAEGDENEEIDLVLEELKKKQEPGE